MSARAHRRIVRRRDRRQGARTASGARQIGRPVRPALAALAVVLIGAGLRTTAIADEGAIEPTIEPAGGGAAIGEDARPMPTESFTRRPYVAIGGGVSRLRPRSPSPALTVSEDVSAGWEIGLGYDVTRWLAAELHAADLGAASIDFLGTDVGDVGYQVYGATAVFYLLNTRDGFVPFSAGREGAHRREGLSLFARFGVGAMGNDSDRVAYRRDHSSHAVFGTGVEYGFRNGLALRGEVQGFDEDALYAGVSVLKRFGRVATVAPPPPVVAPPPAALPVTEPSAPDVVAPPPPTPSVVRFPFDSAELDPEAIAELEGFAEAVRDDDGPIAVDGHADSLGPDAYNLGLSMRRAESVRDYLLSREIPADRVTTRGFGEERPVADNGTSEGRALNRRSEFRLE